MTTRAIGVVVIVVVDMMVVMFVMVIVVVVVVVHVDVILACSIAVMIIFVSPCVFGRFISSHVSIKDSHEITSEVSNLGSVNGCEFIDCKQGICF